MTETVISAWNGIVNIGSESILEVMVEHLTEEIRRENITALSWNPPLTNKIHRIKSISQFSIVNNLKLLKESKNFVLGGGDLLNDFGEGLTFWSSKPLLSKVMNNNVNVYAVGVRPIKSKFGVKLIKKLNKISETLTVRDIYSYQQLSRIIGGDDLELVGDPAFLLGASEEKIATKILQKHGIYEDDKVVGISLRHWLRLRKKYSTVKLYEPNRIIEKLAKELDKIVNMDIKVIFLPMQIAPHSNDLFVASKLDNKMENELLIIDKLYTPKITKAITGKLDFLITMRMHGLIFALTENTIPIGLTYPFAPRVGSILNEFGLEDYKIKIHDIGKYNISRKMRKIEEKDEFKIKAEKNTKKLKQRAVKGIELLKKNLI